MLQKPDIREGLDMPPEFLGLDIDFELTFNTIYPFNKWSQMNGVQLTTSLRRVAVVFFPNKCEKGTIAAWWRGDPVSPEAIVCFFYL